MGRSVVQQWIDELEHCQEWGNPTGVERAVEQLRALGVDVHEVDGRLTTTPPAAASPEPRPARQSRRRTT